MAAAVVLLIVAVWSSEMEVSYLSTFFLFLWIKNTTMKVRPYFAMQKVQKLLKTP